MQVQASQVVFRHKKMLKRDLPFDETGKKMAKAVCRWILRALPYAYQDKRIKNTIGMILSNLRFTRNLEYFCSFELLHTGTRLLLHRLGQELKVTYEREQLATHLGSFHPPLIAGHTKRQDFDLALPPSCDWVTQHQEECYIHFLRLVAYAIDEPYQKLVQECVKDFIVDVQPFHHDGIQGIKGFVRMLNKLVAKDEHRYDKKPRPAQNVDINRCLVAVKDWKGMLGVMKALLARFGPFAKFKNQMALPVDVAETFFHLRLMMPSVRYDTGLTFGDLCASDRVQRLWQQYAAALAPKTVPGGRWDAQIQTALKWLHSPELAHKKVVMMCEVQCAIAQFRDVRVKMHEIYKVHRADSGQALYNDFREIRTKLDQQMQWKDAGSTPHLKQCRDDTPSDGLQAAPNDLQKCLRVACRYGSVEALKSLCRAPNAEDVINKNSFTLLWECSNTLKHRKAGAVFQLLLANKADLNEANKHDGASALHIAASNGHVNMCNLLMANKADVNRERTDDSSSALYIASFYGHTDICELLVAHKANVNQAAMPYDSSPLYIASQEGHMNVCELLLASKASIDKVSHTGTAPLYIASQKGHTDLCELLLANKADINKVTTEDDTSPLYIASQEGHMDLCEMLIANKANVNNRSSDDYTSALDVAQIYGHRDLCELLIAKKADVNQQLLN